MRDLRVCIMGNATWPHVQRWAEHLASRGCGIAILSPVQAHVDGAEVVPFCGDDRRRLLWTYQLARDYRSFARDWQPDIVHVHGIEPWGLAALMFRSCPVVATAYGLDVLWGRAPWRSFRDRLYRRQLLRRSDAVTATSSFLAKATASFAGLAETAVHCMPFGVDLREYRVADPPPDGDLRLAVVKDLKGEYGIDTAISAFSRIAVEVPRASLMLVGQGPLRSQLEEQVRVLGLTDRIVFHGRIPRQDVPALLRTVHIVMMPSRIEALGVSALEAQAVGIPVVASRVGGICEAVQDGQTGLLVEPNDATALAEAVLSLARDAERRAEMGRRGRRFVRAHYDWDATTALMERLYCSVLS